jgi:hypothetical protein
MCTEERRLASLFYVEDLCSAAEEFMQLAHEKVRKVLNEEIAAKLGKSWSNIVGKSSFTIQAKSPAKFCLYLRMLTHLHARPTGFPENCHGSSYIYPMRPKYR